VPRSFAVDSHGGQRWKYSDTVMTSLAEKLQIDGYALLTQVVDAESLSAATDDLAQLMTRGHRRLAGLRNILKLSAVVRDLARSPSFTELVEPILGKDAKVVRGLYFDKRAEANWKVAWHQDLSIAVKERSEIAGYGPWSVKAGITHVQPPAALLEQMLTLRLHLDDTDETNGALRVLPGTHRLGRLSAERLQEYSQRMEIHVCNVQHGGVMLMRPLLAHSSSTSQLLRRRRVIHLEYCGAELPDGLEWDEAV